MCVQKFVNFALKRPHSNLQWFGTVVSLAMRERRYWTNSMLLLWVLLRSLLRTSAFRYTIRFDLLDESICFPQTFGPFDLSTTCCSHSVRKVWFANSVCVYALYADLWRRSTTRGHSWVTLRSSPTMRWWRCLRAGRIGYAGSHWWCRHTGDLVIPSHSLPTSHFLPWTKHISHLTRGFCFGVRFQSARHNDSVSCNAVQLNITCSWAKFPRNTINAVSEQFACRSSYIKHRHRQILLVCYSNKGRKSWIGRSLTYMSHQAITQILATTLFTWRP